jgi:hypothetical protein
VRLGRVIGVVAPGLVAPIARLAGANRVREAWLRPSTGWARRSAADV